MVTDLEDARLPKVNFFCWTMVHGEILVGEILKKHGFRGPFCCDMCEADEETLIHIFLYFPYSKSIWAIFHIFSN
jgi:hypothetical protein